MMGNLAIGFGLGGFVGILAAKLDERRLKGQKSLRESNKDTQRS